MVNGSELGFFLGNIWLIPLFPLFGAALMLLIGRRLDPQVKHEHAHDAHHEHGGAGKTLISILCPGTVLVAFLFGLKAVLELAARAPADRSVEVIVFRWLTGFGNFQAPWGFLL